MYETPPAHAGGFFCFKISASLDFAQRTAYKKTPFSCAGTFIHPRAEARGIL